MSSLNVSSCTEVNSVLSVTMGEEFNFLSQYLTEPLLPIVIPDSIPENPPPDE
jgi:hypothetical protein